jgi:hypothetical protein
MHLPNRMLAGAALLVAAACAQAAPCSNLEPARWLLGQWEALSGDKRVLETWREVSATTFEGSGVTSARADAAVLEGEDLRLVAMLDAVFSPTAGIHEAARWRARGDRQRRRGARFQASVPQAGSDRKPNRPVQPPASRSRPAQTARCNVMKLYGWA